MDSSSFPDCVWIDDTFGPWARDCRGGLDFTLTFEETILTILPACILILAFSFRIRWLFSQQIAVIQNRAVLYKLCLYTLLAALQLAFTILWTRPTSIATRTSAASAAVAFVTTIFVSLLSYTEHARSIRPSSLLNVFLLGTLLFDAAHTRTLWLQEYNRAPAVVMLVMVCVKFIALVLEAREKRSILRPEHLESPPEATAGIFNSWFFWWENSLLRMGYGKNLRVADLFALDSYLKSEFLQSKLQKAWAPSRSRNLLLVTLRTFSWPIICAIPYRACLVALTFCQPLLINRAVRLSEEEVTQRSVNAGYGLIGAYILVYMGMAITAGQYQHLTYRTITMARGALVSMLYGKATTLNITSVDAASSLTLMSADIERITTGWQTMHELWANIAEIILAIVLLQQQLGAAAAVPIGVALISLFGSASATSLVISRQKAWLEAIEKRIAATATMLGAMKPVKMCGLSDVLWDRLQVLRVSEMNISKGFRKLLIWNMMFSYVTPVAAPILTFAVFSVIARNSGGETTLDTARVFTSLSLFSLLSEPLQSFIMSLTTFMGSVGSFARIQEFLDKKEHEDFRIAPDDESDYKSLRASSKSISAGSNFSKEKVFSVENLDLNLSLKSDTYYHSSSEAISLKDVTLTWTEDDNSVLRNIGVDFEREKFSVIVGPVGCGKSTLVKAILGEVPWSEGSITVSSTSVAYCEQTPWHMNCTIQESIVGAASRLDEFWYNEVVEACALTEDFKQLAQGDQTKIGSKGVALSGGQSQRIALARAVYAQKDIVLLDDVLSSLDEDTENHIFHHLFGQYGLFRRNRSTVVLASSSVKRVPYADHIVVIGDYGTIIEQGTFDELNVSGGYIAGFSLSAGSQTAPAPRKSYFSKTSNLFARPVRSQKPTPDSDALDADDSRRTGDIAVYTYYIKAIGWIPTVVFVVGIVGFIFCNSFPNLWVKWWAAANATSPNEDLEYWLSIYAALGVLALVCLVISCWQMIITMVPKSGINFHSKLLKTVLNAPMTFFSTTDLGVTLNRFSQDLQLVDMELPITALNTFAIFVMCIAQMVLIGIASKYAAIAFPVCIFALFFIQKYYLRTSRQLRFLDLETKSPLYSEFVECLSGLATIRAFGWQDALHYRNRGLLDASQRPFYLLFAVQRWLTLILDLMVGAVAVLLIILVVELRGTISSGYVGVALLNVIIFSQNLKVFVMFWAMLETHIGAIARIKVFSKNTVNENLAIENVEPPSNWPSQGAIEFKTLSAAYKPPHNVVENVTLSIKPGEKVAICGRTGSGKSSLILTMFRMLDQTGGQVLVDGLDLSTIDRQTVRSRLNGVPQDSYLFPGTVQENADPFGECTETDIIEALEDVQLWELISAKGGLSIDLESCHLTHGQKQLFCLARTLLRPGKIVVLDEATSSIDSQTEALIQSVLRTKFAFHTVVVVAHKLESVLDFDMVALMDNGRVIEYDAPYELLSRPSRFKELYESSKQQADDDTAVA